MSAKPSRSTLKTSTRATPGSYIGQCSWPDGHTRGGIPRDNLYKSLLLIRLGQGLGANLTRWPSREIDPRRCKPWGSWCPRTIFASLSSIPTSFLLPAFGMIIDLCLDRREGDYCCWYGLRTSGMTGKMGALNALHDLPGSVRWPRILIYESLRLTKASAPSLSHQITGSIYVRLGGINY